MRNVLAPLVTVVLFAIAACGTDSPPTSRQDASESESTAATPTSPDPGVIPAQRPSSPTQTNGQNESPDLFAKTPPATTFSPPTEPVPKSEEAVHILDIKSGKERPHWTFSIKRVTAAGAGKTFGGTMSDQMVRVQKKDWVIYEAEAEIIARRNGDEADWQPLFPENWFVIQAGEPDTDWAFAPLGAEMIGFQNDGQGAVLRYLVSLNGVFHGNIVFAAPKDSKTFCFRFLDYDPVVFRTKEK